MKKLSIVLIVLLFTISIGCVHDPINPEMPIEPDEIVVSDCDSDSVYYENDILPIILANCTFQGCHIQNTEVESVTNAYYDYLKRKSVPGDPEASKLYTSLVTDNLSDLMPRDKDTKEPFSLGEEKIGKIKKWIEQGALKNGCSECGTTDFSFAGNINPIIQANCANSNACHGEGSNQGEFTSYEGLSAVIENGLFEERVLVIKDMPKGGELSECELSSIQKWINDGAQNN